MLASRCLDALPRRIGALDKAKTVLVSHHIEHHLEEAVGELSPEARQMLAQLSELAKFL